MVVSLLALVGCDHVTKYVAKAELENQPPRQMIASVLDLRYVQNTDTAFNLLRSVPQRVRRPMLLGFGAAALLAFILALLLALVRWPGAPVPRMAFVLIVAGAIGNYLDRLFRGYVVDFIHVPHWPVFNVADICVTVGIALFFWTSLSERKRHRAV